MAAFDDTILVPDWRVPARVRAAVTTRRVQGASSLPFDASNLGAHCGDDPAAVAANRAALLPLLGLPAAPRWLRQVHGIDVHRALAAAPTQVSAPAHPREGTPAPPHAQEAEILADACYTRDAGVVCAVLTADCLPLLVASDEGNEVAAIHAGWRGLAAGVIEATLQQFEAAPSRLRVWLGPAIGVASYEVGEEVRAAFVTHDESAAQAFAPTRPGHFLCDLYALARLRLAAFGVGDASGGGFDTFTDARFCSHRRGAPVGRFASLIWIDGERA